MLNVADGDIEYGEEDVDSGDYNDNDDNVVIWL